ncbi:hypothetical protein EG856_00705 [Mycoplasmopsis phocirhinis]|uniref:Lipoprotein n=1 Tax=Mycoplasmopsis phocirhinis TaxID=142650 RepID=A0A4P6MRJ9_9BACT|nr:hypothetical protein [Mycoplasmopsis phocirhinis]QBF34451.1 hypothetical protein EG856_00705 [Mycoplasmopsis phocirhinis]
MLGKLKWKKNLKLILAAGTLQLIPVAASGCFFADYNPIPKPKPQPQKPNKPDQNKINGGGLDNENKPQLEQVREYNYQGMIFKIASEDSFEDKQFYADMVLANDAQEFKNLIPKYQDYWIRNLLEEDFKTLVDISRYVRNVEYDKTFAYAQNDKRNISAQEFNALITKLLEILDQQQYYDFNSKQNADVKITHLFNYDNAHSVLQNWYQSTPYKAHYDDFLSLYEGSETFGRKLITKNIIAGLEFDDTITYEEIKVKDADAPRSNVGGKIVKYNSALWKLNRDINLNNMFDNEMFLSRAFYEKSLAQDEIIGNDWIDWTFLNDSSVLAMQLPQYKMLVAYLRLMKKLTDSINFNVEENDSEEAKAAKIKQNGSIVDDNKTLIQNLLDSGIATLIDKYEKALLDYLALEHLMGFMSEEKNDPNFQLFPGGSNYTYKVDYRDSYKWAKQQYEDFVLAFRFGFGQAIWASSSSSSYNERFNNPKTLAKYELIWDNIKRVDNIDKPRLISPQQAQNNLDRIIKTMRTKFKWKFKN